VHCSSPSSASLNCPISAAPAASPAPGNWSSQAHRTPFPTDLRADRLEVIAVLLYTTGLRLGELVRLILRDYDPHERTLLIRDSKFHKSRLVPLSSDAAREIHQYLVVRQTRQLTISPDSALLWHRTRRGTGYTGTGLSHAIRPLLRAAQTRTEAGRVPRLHDFRHTFAVQALL
jgi:integrase